MTPTLGYTVTIDGKVYAVGEEVTLQDPELVHDAALSKIRAAGLSPEEARALGIQL